MNCGQSCDRACHFRERKIAELAQHNSDIVSLISWCAVLDSFVYRALKELGVAHQLKVTSYEDRPDILKVRFPPLLYSILVHDNTAFTAWVPTVLGREKKVNKSETVRSQPIIIPHHLVVPLTLLGRGTPHEPTMLNQDNRDHTQKGEKVRILPLLFTCLQFVVTLSSLSKLTYTSAEWG